MKDIYMATIKNKYQFRIIYENKFLDVEKQISKIEDKMVSFGILLTNKILEKETNSKIDEIYPIPLLTEGIVPEFFYTVQKFKDELIDKSIVERFTQEEIKRIIYQSDLISIIRSIENYLWSASESFIKLSDRINEVLFQHLDNSNEELKDMENTFEYKYIGGYVTEITSLYSGIIIQLCSVLDLTAKLLYEISMFPKNFDKYIKLKSGNIYFNDINKCREKYKSYKGFENSFFSGKRNYTDLIMVRNAIVHNAFFINDESLFFGYKTHVVNYKPINYIISYVWDVDKDGKPERWLNRFRFYGQERETDTYLLNYFIKFYSNMDATIDMLFEYIAHNI